MMRSFGVAGVMLLLSVWAAAQGASALQRQDQRLDRDYRRLRARLRHEPGKQADLRNEQRDWLRHRDFACSGTGGSAHIGCLVRETAKKADALEMRLRRGA